MTLLLLLACAAGPDAPATESEPTATGDTAVDGTPIAVSWTGEPAVAVLVQADTTGEITLLGETEDAASVTSGAATLHLLDPGAEAVEDEEGNQLATWMVGALDGDVPLGAWPGYLAWSWLAGTEQPAFYLVYLDDSGVHVDPFDPTSDAIELGPNLLAEEPGPLTGTLTEAEEGLSVDLFHLPTLTGEAPVDEPVLATTEVSAGAFAFATLPPPPDAHPVAELAGEETTGILVSAYVGVLYEELDGTEGIGDDDRLVVSTVTEEGTTLLLHLEPTDLRAVLYPAAYGLQMGWSLFEVIGEDGAPRDWKEGLDFPAP